MTQNPTPLSPAELSSSRQSNMSAWMTQIGPVLALIAIVLLFWWLAPAGSFMTWPNFETILRQTVIVGTAALGMTLVIIMGGIDLSAGSVVALSTVVVALALNAHHEDAAGTRTYLLEQYPVLWAIVAGLSGIIVGTLAGIINGGLVVSLRVVPFIITLGTLLIVRGAAKGLAGEMKVNPPDIDTWLTEILSTLPPDRAWMLLPPGVWIMLLLAVLATLVLRYTRLGRHAYAIGSNEATARLCGISVGRTKIMVYGIMGLMAGLAGLMQFSRLTVGDPTVASGLELDIIAAVVIGGGSLSGGEGSILGSLVGALIMNVIRTGCTKMGRPNWEQEIITGLIIISAVALDRLRHRKMS